MTKFIQLTQKDNGRFILVKIENIICIQEEIGFTLIHAGSLFYKVKESYSVILSQWTKITI